MGTKERREREREQLRGLILDAAREMFVERGYEGVSMRKIAEKIEYSPTAIYQHFKDKDALVREICREDSQKLTEELKSSGAVEDPMERLMACGMAYARFAVENPNHYKMLFLSQLPAAAYEGDVADFGKGEPEMDGYALLRQQVRALAPEAFRYPGMDPDLVAQTLWAGVHGVVSLEVTQCLQGWVDWHPLEERVWTMLGAMAAGLFREVG